MIDSNDYKIFAGLIILKYGPSFIQPIFKDKNAFFMQFKSGSGCRMEMISELTYQNLSRDLSFMRFSGTENFNLDLNKMINGFLLDNNVVTFGNTEDFIAELEANENTLSKENLKMLKEIKEKFGHLDEAYTEVANMQ